MVAPQALFGRLFGGGAARMVPGKKVEEAEAELLQFISTLKRGVDATDSDKQRVDEMAQVLTAVNWLHRNNRGKHSNILVEVAIIRGRSLAMTFIRVVGV